MKRERTVQMFRLRYKMFCVLLLGIAAAVGFYFAVEYLGESLINRWYMNEEAIEERQEKYEESLSRYVQENQVSIRDVSRISNGYSRKKMCISSSTTEIMSCMSPGGGMRTATYIPRMCSRNRTSMRRMKLRRMIRKRSRNGKFRIGRSSGFGGYDGHGRGGNRGNSGSCGYSAD